MTSAPRKMTGCWNTGGLRGKRVSGAAARGRRPDLSGHGHQRYSGALLVKTPYLWHRQRTPCGDKEARGETCFSVTRSGRGCRRCTLHQGGQVGTAAEAGPRDRRVLLGEMTERFQDNRVHRVHGLQPTLDLRPRCRAPGSRIALYPTPQCLQTQPHILRG